MTNRSTPRLAYREAAVGKAAATQDQVHLSHCIRYKNVARVNAKKSRERDAVTYAFGMHSCVEICGSTAKSIDRIPGEGSPSLTSHRLGRG